MPRRPVWAQVAAAGLVFGAVVACSSDEADGARKKICGTWIGAPADGVDRSPWYVDASDHAPAGPVRAYVELDAPHRTVSIVNLRVSGDCARGAKVEVSPAGTLSVVTGVQGGDGNPVVVIVTPKRNGRAGVTATRPGHAPVTVSFVVTGTRQGG